MSVTVGNLIIDLLQLYSILIIVRAVMSWLRVDPRNQLARILQGLTDPVLDPIQRVVPPVGGAIDVSPIIALVFVQLLIRVVARIMF